MSGVSEKRYALIVDDDVVVRSCIRKMLKERGYDVMEAGTAALALAAIQKRRFTLVFLDHFLPDKTGLSILDAVRASSREVKVALMSTDAKVFGQMREKPPEGVVCFPDKVISPVRLEQAIAFLEGRPYTPPTAAPIAQAAAPEPAKTAAPPEAPAPRPVAGASSGAATAGAAAPAAGDSKPPAGET
jgi:CheY-like chemotaxis protein